MAGTHRDHAPLGEPTAIPGPAMILVEPQLGENIGATARALWNFGLTDLRLVNPRDGWPNPAAEAMASGATALLDSARVFPSVAEAAAEITTLYATTARRRDLTKRVLSPREAALEMRDRRAAGEQVGILFGRERTGLENDDVVRANAIIAVPANPSFASLNLAQCALLTAYEWRLASVAPTPPPDPESGEARASREAVDRLYTHLEEALDRAGYFWPEPKRPAMAQSLRNFISRVEMTDQDARMLHGALRALGKRRDVAPD